ncbi:MAG: hypothetical protein QXX19_07535 [Candidatus Caldarchaeum sp.]
MMLDLYGEKLKDGEPKNSRWSSVCDKDVDEFEGGLDDVLKTRPAGFTG